MIWVWRLLLVAPLAIGSSFAFGTSIEKLEQIVTEARSLEDFLGRDDLLRQYRQALESYYNQVRFPCEGFDTVLSGLRKLSREIPEYGQALWQRKVPDSMPEITEVLSPDGGKTVTEKRVYRFRSLPRKLHGIWNDPSKTSCGVNTCDKLKVSAPDRWVVGLGGSEVYLIERNGRFAGAAFWVLTLNKENEKFFLASVLGSPFPTKRSLFQNPKTLTVRDDTLFNQWMSFAPFPKKQIVVLEPSKKNASIIYLVRIFPAVKGNKIAGSHFDFDLRDSIGGSISKIMPRSCLSGGKKVELNLWGGFSGMSQNSEKNIMGINVNFQDPKKVSDYLNQMDDPDDAGIMDLLSEEKLTQMGKGLSDVLLKNKSPTLREKAAIALGLLNKRLALLDQEKGKGISGPEKSSATKPARAPASVDYNKALRSALNDEFPAVRESAALSLLDQGDSSPGVLDVLNDTQEGTSSPSQAADTNQGHNGKLASNQMSEISPQFPQGKPGIPNMDYQNQFGSRPPDSNPNYFPGPGDYSKIEPPPNHGGGGHWQHGDDPPKFSPLERAAWRLGKDTDHGRITGADNLQSVLNLMENNASITDPKTKTKLEKAAKEVARAMSQMSEEQQKIVIRDLQKTPEAGALLGNAIEENGKKFEQKCNIIENREKMEQETKRLSPKAKL